MKRSSTIRIASEVVRTLELEPIQMNGFSGDLRLRLEVVKSAGKASYEARLWKLEYYRVLPSFQERLKQKVVADEQVLVPCDHLFFAKAIRGTTAARVLDEALRQLRRRVGPAL